MERQNKKKSIPENICVLFNYGNRLHTFLRRSTALVGEGLLIVQITLRHIT